MKEILEQLKNLYIGYSSIYRHSAQPEKVRFLKKSSIEFGFQDEISRESLIEHVGHLPITASFLYNYLEDKEVDLGRSLIILSIHDIGELGTGDKAIFVKKESDSKEEIVVAKELLSKEMMSYFMEYENLTSKSAQFAKSVDKIVADIIEFFVPREISFERYKSMGIAPKNIIEMKKEKKLKYMEWNPFLSQFYPFLLENLQKYFDGN